MGQVNLSNALMNMPNSSNNTQKASTQITSNLSSSNFSESFSKAKTSINANNTKKTDDAKKQVKSSKDNIKEKTEAKNKKELVVQPKKSDKLDHSELVKKDSTKTSSASSKKAQRLDEDDQIDAKDKKASNDQQSLIIDLISEHLQLPVIEVQSLLQQMGLNPEDLLTQEGFSTFISEALAKGDMSQLLTGDLDMKEINKLFDALSALEDSQNGHTDKDNSVLHLMSQVQNATEVYHEVKEEAHIISKQEAREEMHAILAETNIKESNPRYDSDENADALSTQIVDGIQGSDEMGMSMPVHHFTSSAQTQTNTFDMGDGLIAHTTVTKHEGRSHFVLDHVDFKVIGQKRELSVQLSPKELGTMNIKIVENNGALVAEIKVDNEKTRGFILNEIDVLKNNLEEQGLNVSEVKVDIRQNDAREQMEQQKQKSSKRIQEIIGKQFGEEEAVEEDTKIDSDSEVDYKV